MNPMKVVLLLAAVAVAGVLWRARHGAEVWHTA